MLSGMRPLPLLLLMACVPAEPPHSAAYYACTNECARQKDECMLEAFDAKTVNVCDAKSRECGARCR
jgi:hypothetical protein